MNRTLFHAASLPRPILAGLFCSAILIACSGQESASETYATPLRTGSEVRAELRSACEAALAGSSPLLLEFSAPWCSDCQRLHEMKQAVPLAREMERWSVVVVNVNQFDRHRDLLDGFGVRKIAHWAVLEPRDCDEPPEEWRRIVQRTLEPSSGGERTRTPDDLARWLRSLREARADDPA